MSAPVPSGNAQPLYLGPSGKEAEPQGFVSWFWNQQVMNPEYREGNIGIARAVALFGLGILFVRSDMSAAILPAI